MDQSTPGLPVLHYLLEFAQTHVHWVGDKNQPSHPLSPSSPPALKLSVWGFFPNESALPIWWLKFWSFSFSISPSSDYSGLISFRIYWCDLLTVQGTLKNLLQHHSSKASILWHSALRSNSHICTWLLEKPSFWLQGPLSAKGCLCFLIEQY